MSEVGAAVRAAGARIHDGPTDTDAYILDIPDATYTRGVAILRQQRSVTMAVALSRGKTS